MPDPLQLLEDRLHTPIGEMLIIADREGNLRVTDWTDHEDRMQQLLTRYYGRGGFTLQKARNPHGLTHALEEYFSGDLTAIDTVPVETVGTPFQRKVWSALRTIPCGATVSYMALAAQIGHPTAVRAVGLANGSNPIGVVVPCHRVIGANGSLTGYGGGLHRKSWLLQHESALPSQPQKALFA
ncbi:MAG TPA: methylated-DNA--[protein]-cysteine S-methyltransferase [Acidobacteriaceae bacterium]